MSQSKPTSVVLNLAGGPSTGKSSSARLLAASYGLKGYNVELVGEAAKIAAWEERIPVTYDQFFFFGKQSRREYTLYNRANIIVTESPLFITSYYTKVHGSAEWDRIFRQMYLTYRSEAERNGVVFVDIFLTRVGPYQPRGRFQTEAEAIAIDGDLKQYMRDLGLHFMEFPSGEAGVKSIMNALEPTLASFPVLTF